MKIKRGKKQAEINLKGFSINELISILKSQQKKKQQTKLIEYNNLKSVYESSDKKDIIFEFSDRSFSFNLPNSKFYDCLTKKVLNLSECRVFIRQKLSNISSTSDDDTLSVVKVCRENWIKTFFKILYHDNPIRNGNSFFRSFSYMAGSKKYSSTIEQLAKQEFIQNLNESKFEKFCSILTDYETLSSNFVFKEFKKEWFWLLENSDIVAASCDVQHTLGDHFENFENAKKENLEDLFKYAFNNYRYIIGWGENLSDYKYLIKNGYEPNRLIDYVCRDMPNQGLSPNGDDYDSSLNILLDYARMNIQMKKDFEKYPRYLRTYHDVTSKNYEVARNKTMKSKFAKKVKNFKKYEYKNENYSVISPKSFDDLVSEGAKLYHCVASYAEEIANESTIIMFVRKNNSLDIPLVTIEINKNKIVQAKGKNNSQPQSEEKKFLEEYKQYLLKC